MLFSFMLKFVRPNLKRTSNNGIAKPFPERHVEVAWWVISSIFCYDQPVLERGELAYRLSFSMRKRYIQPKGAELRNDSPQRSPHRCLRLWSYCFHCIRIVVRLYSFAFLVSNATRVCNQLRSHRSQIKTSHWSCMKLVVRMIARKPIVSLVCMTGASSFHRVEVCFPFFLIASTHVQADNDRCLF